MNKTVPMALDKLGYAPTEVEEIVAFIDERNTIVDDHVPDLLTQNTRSYDRAHGNLFLASACEI